MDLNIGAALWLAAQAEGELYGGGEGFRSSARVVLLGHGADELCGGYGRHRTAFRHQVWLAFYIASARIHAGLEPCASSSCAPNSQAAAAGGRRSGQLTLLAFGMLLHACTSCVAYAGAHTMHGPTVLHKFHPVLERLLRLAVRAAGVGGPVCRTLARHGAPLAQKPGQGRSHHRRYRQGRTTPVPGRGIH